MTEFMSKQFTPPTPVLQALNCVVFMVTLLKIEPHPPLGCKIVDREESAEEHDDDSSGVNPMAENAEIVFTAVINIAIIKCCILRKYYLIKLWLIQRAPRYCFTTGTSTPHRNHYWPPGRKPFRLGFLGIDASFRSRLWSVDCSAVIDNMQNR